MSDVFNKISVALSRLVDAKLHVSPSVYKALERFMQTRPYYSRSFEATIPKTLLVLGHEVVADETVGDNEMVVKCEF